LAKVLFLIAITQWAIRMKNEENQTKPLPFVAPCYSLELSAPWRCLKLGCKDVFRAPVISLSYGVVMTALILAVTVMAWQYGSAWILFSLLCGFVFIAPVACVGTYATSAQLERGQSVSFKQTLSASFKRTIGTELVLNWFCWLFSYCGRGRVQ
jgi:uncharacterized membrane protein